VDRFRRTGSWDLISVSLERGLTGRQVAGIKIPGCKVFAGGPTKHQLISVAQKGYLHRRAGEGRLSSLKRLGLEMDDL
jgi:hypothetical protein